MPADRALTAILMGLAVTLAAAQNLDDDSTQLLKRIASVVRNNTNRLPNYTCMMTVERTERVVKTGKPQMADRIRLEVAMVGDKELYSWPGARSFHEPTVQDIAPKGTFSTGEFGSLMIDIFLSGTAEFTYDGMEELNGRKVHHFAYRIPRERSKYTVVVPTARGIVGYEGSAWCDAQSLDLVRLEIVIREIPQNLPLSAGHMAIDYARARVGRGEFLLPQSVDSTFIFDGLEARNRTSFSGCHEYAVESGISFGEIPATEATAAAKPAPAVIPAGVMIESKLNTELDPAQLATGDPFEATVSRTAHQKNIVVAPKGARIHGHVSAVLTSATGDGCLGIMLHPDWIEFEGRQGAFDAEQVVPIEPVIGPRSFYARCPWKPEPGSAMVYMQRGRLSSRSGYELDWRTLKPAGAR